MIWKCWFPVALFRVKDFKEEIDKIISGDFRNPTLKKYKYRKGKPGRVS